MNKDGQPEMAREIYEDLRARMPAEFDTGGSIGKRYRRQDEIGTPWGVTVDHQTMEDGTVTLRDRDSLEQARMPRERRARPSSSGGWPRRGAAPSSPPAPPPDPPSERDRPEERGGPVASVRACPS